MARNARRMVAPTIRSMVSNLRYINTVWCGRMATTWKPEHDQQSWQQLALYMDTVARQARSVADYARDQMKELPE